MQGPALSTFDVHPSSSRPLNQPLISHYGRRPGPGSRRDLFNALMRRPNQQQLYSQGARRLITLDRAGARLAGLFAPTNSVLYMRPICGRYFEARGVIMMPSHDIGVQGQELCSDRRSTRDCSRRAAPRYLVGSSLRLICSTAHRTIACGVSCHSPRRISCGVS